MSVVRNREKVGDTMQIRLRILEYMEKSKISVDDVAKELQIDKEKFQRDSKKNWSAEDLLEVCGYLQVDPRMFWKRTQEK